MLTDTEWRWVRHALTVDHQSAMAKAKMYRTVGQIFEKAAQRIEQNLVDKVDARLYNTNTETTN